VKNFVSREKNNMTNYKYIMGIQSYANHDSGACIIKFSDDGELLRFMAISEERLIRIKYPYTFPIHSIDYCMKFFGLTDINQIDLLITEYIRIKRWFTSSPTYNVSDYDYLKVKFDIDPKKIRTISHHMAHAASAYYVSGFDEAAVLVVDGNGSDLETTSYFHGKGDNLQLIENYKYYGIAACYDAVTKQILGFGTGEQGKTMGLSPYGEKYDQVLHINADLDGIKNNFSKFMRRMPYSDMLNQISAENRINPLKGNYKKCIEKKNLLNPYFSRAAYDIQEETERVLVHLSNDLYSKTNSRNLCISGGVGLNSVSNKIVLDKCRFDNIFIFPACSDAGIPFGLAIWGYYNCSEFNLFKKKKYMMKNAYLGIEYSKDYTLDVFKKYDITYSNVDLSFIAKAISEGKIVGWFQGGSEYGPRALGHRSILADSRDKEMKDILNLRVKHRESFRPFAPSILKEFSNEYFDIECESPYMLLVAKVKKPDIIPATTHIDRTARIQTISKEENDVFYNLLMEFYKITGVPCILNTSFNEAGEPIVETPNDAIICSLKNKIDFVVIGQYLVDCNRIKNKEEKVKIMIEDREESIKTSRERIIDKYFTGYNEKEKSYFIAESDKISEWYTKYKCKYEIEKIVLHWVENKRKIIIVGTRDHTEILPKYINYFCLVHVVGFCNYKDYHDKNYRSKIEYSEISFEDAKETDYDEILVSSHEYNFEIYEYLKSKNIGKPIYVIYDNTSRSFIETLKGFPIFKYKKLLNKN